jgi:hypothetical protein
MYGETSTPRAFFLLFLILLFLFTGFYLFIRALKVISPKGRHRVFPLHLPHDHHHDEDR